MEPLLRVENLTVGITNGKRSYTAVEDVSFTVCAGQTLGIAGESGCGKSVTCLSLLRLAPPNVKVTSGGAYYGGLPLTHLSDREFDPLRGREFSMIFQDTASGLNPLMRVGKQIAEAIWAGRSGRRRQSGISAMSRASVKPAEAVALLKRVRIDDAERCARSYPHELSGGQRQRVMIAIAIAAEPGLLIADEPTTALDVSTKMEILGLLRELQRQSGMALIIISHDVGVIREMCDDALIMYLGRVVEAGRASDLLDNPLHPYSAGLARAAAVAENRGKPLYTIDGTVESLEQRNRITGCVFANRCDIRCEQSGISPPPVTVGDGTGARMCRCHKYTNTGRSS